MPILNYATKVSATRTASEIQSLLARKGAKRVSIDFDLQGDPSAIEFTIEVCKQPVNFKLPCNVAGVEKAIARPDARCPKRLQTKAQALRAAWRIVKNWVDVQIAMIESNQMDMAEVFLPYAIDARGESMYALFKESKQKQLTDGN